MNRRVYRTIKTGRKGVSLLEVILTLAVSAMILTSIVSLTSKSVSTSTLSRNKAQANRYAGEAVEFVRTQKEFNGWSIFFNAIKDSSDGSTTGPEIWCLTTLAFNINHECTASDVIPNTMFKRTLTVTGDSNVLDINVKVEWTDEKGTHETFSSTVISNW